MSTRAKRRIAQRDKRLKTNSPGTFRDEAPTPHDKHAGRARPVSEPLSPLPYHSAGISWPILRMDRCRIYARPM